VRLLIVSEGKHELGTPERAGALETLVRRLIGHPCACDVLKVSDPALRGRFHGTGPGYFKKALRCVLHGAENGYDGVVLVIDQDDQPERRRQLADAQDHVTLAALPMGVAVVTFDAWMLADERALSNVLGHPVQRQPDPETIRDAKAACAALRDLARSDLSISGLYAELAEVIDLIALTDRCAVGFAPFAARVRQMGRGTIP